jgi:hypothetical protein
LYKKLSNQFYYYLWTAQWKISHNKKRGS